MMRWAWLSSISVSFLSIWTKVEAGRLAASARRQLSMRAWTWLRVSECHEGNPSA